MIKRYNLTRQDLKTVGDAARWKPFLRKFEIDKTFDGLHKDYFERALELGCGSGEHSKYLAFYCKKLIAIEYNKDRLTSCSNDKTTFLVADAQDLSQFPDNEMDLIFSKSSYKVPLGLLLVFHHQCRKRLFLYLIHLLHQQKPLPILA